jgi:hypothetical protein
MENMTGWDLALLVVVGYVAVMSMARLMIARRDQFLAEFRQETKAEQERLAAEEAERSQAEEAERQSKAA